MHYGHQYSLLYPNHFAGKEEKFFLRKRPQGRAYKKKFL